VQWRGAAPDPTTNPGIADGSVDGDRRVGTLRGDILEFVRSIASPSLKDLTIEPATLEEAFLEYYAEDGILPSAPTASTGGATVADPPAADEPVDPEAPR
jgi:hypothetical protein